MIEWLPPVSGTTAKNQQRNDYLRSTATPHGSIGSRSVQVILLGSALGLSAVGSPAAGQGTSLTAPPAACRTFVLKRAAAGVSLEAVDLAAGETRVFEAGPGSEIIDLVVPVGPGSSGSLASLTDRRLLIVRCEGGALQLERRLADGKSSKPPAQRMSELRGYDVRLSVSFGDGARAAFLLKGYHEAVRDSIGPIKNPFAGRVPLSENDFVVFTETTRRETGPPASGSAALELAGHMYVPASVAGGGEGRMILDLAASTSLVSRSFVPDGVDIEEAGMVEYSPEGRRLMKYAPGGATGAVTSVIGLARLPELQVGGIRFTDVEVEVVDVLPEWFGEDVGGILGMDLLRRARAFALTLPAGDSGRLELLEGDDAAVTSRGRATDEVIELPFSLATHIFVPGAIDSLPVSFILDTGSPSSFVDAAVADALGWSQSEGRQRIRGMDEQGTDVWSAEKDLTLGGRTFSDVQFWVGQLPVLSPISLNDQLVGLFGISLLQRFTRIEIDFERGVVRLYPASTDGAGPSRR